MKQILILILIINISYADKLYKFKYECEENKNGSVCFDIGNVYIDDDIEQAKKYFQKACELENFSGCIALFDIDKKGVSK